VICCPSEDGDGHPGRKKPDNHSDADHTETEPHDPTNENDGQLSLEPYRGQNQMLQIMELTGIHHPINGRRISKLELAALKKDQVCFNCFEAGHYARDCTADWKPYTDGWVDDNGNVVPGTQHNTE